MTENLYDIAEKLGVRTVEDLHTPGLLGGYHEPTGTIVLASGMTARQYRSVLAHELAHLLCTKTLTRNATKPWNVNETCRQLNGS